MAKEAGETSEEEFEKMLREKYGFEIEKMAEDGNCLFRGVGKFKQRVKQTKSKHPH